MKAFFILTTVFVFSIAINFSSAYAAEGNDIKLPEPEKTGGMPLMQAFASRKSDRSFSTRKLDTQKMANLLWAAFGINRKNGKRTAPSAMNQQEISIYVTLEKGLYLYEPEKNNLKFISDKDLRKDTGKQPFVESAPLNLVYVADLKKMKTDDKQMFYAAADTGFIAQNVYLYCASSGLGTVVRGYLDPEALAKKMGLDENKKVVLAQTVGYIEN